MAGNIISFFSRGAGDLGGEPKQKLVLNFTQLSLHLEREHCVVVFALDEVDGKSFLRQVKELKPAYIADLRYFRHFNLLGTGASFARNALNGSGARYFHEEISYDDFESLPIKCNVVKSHCQKVVDSVSVMSGQSHGPVFVLVHHNRHARVISEYMKEILAPSKKWWATTFDDGCRAD